MDVSVIIVNYNTRAITSECINSIFRMTRDITYEVILVDNASSDGSREFFENDSRITYIYNRENLGFGRANNIGFEYASGDFIFLLNSDTILLNNAISLFFKTIKKMPDEVGCLGSILLDKNERPTYSYGSFLNWSVLFPWCNKMNFTEEIPHEGKTVECVLGADLFVRRNLIEEYGFFDPRFFMYNEENDLQRRFFQNGYVSKIIDGPRIVHLEGKSNKDAINIRTIEGTFVYMRKWMPLPSYLIFRVLFALTRLPKAFMSNAPIHVRKDYLKMLIGL